MKGTVNILTLTIVWVSRKWKI